MTLEVGANALAPADAETQGDGQVQVACGWAPTGEVVILLRVGNVVAPLTRTAALLLAKGLADEVIESARLDQGGRPQ